MTASQIIDEIETLSQAKLEANRANAQLSTGPKTEEGKERSKKNAWRHGLTGQVACMPDEDRNEFNRFCAAIVEDYHPEGAIETQLAQTIAEDYWRLNRGRAWETNTLTYGSFNGADRTLSCEHPQLLDAFTQVKVVEMQGESFARIALYETRINRNIEKNEKRLKARQAERQAAFEQAVEEARLLASADAASADSTSATRVGGFVFSTAKIFAAVTHRTRLEAAKLTRPLLRKAA